MDDALTARRCLHTAPLEVVGVDGSMYLVRLPDGTTAWIEAGSAVLSQYRG